MLSTEVGYYICGASTLLWTPFSPACRACIRAALCRKRTEMIYGELYRIRMEEYSGKEDYERRAKSKSLSAGSCTRLYATALHTDSLCGVVAQHMRPEYLPDRSFQKIQQAIASHFRTYKRPPSYAMLAQTFAADYDAIELLDTFREYDEGDNPEAVTDMLEAYIKGVRLQGVYGEVGKLYNQSKQGEAEKVLGSTPSGWEVSP